MRTFVTSFLLGLNVIEAFMPHLQPRLLRPHQTQLQNSLPSDETVERLQNDYRGLLQAVEYQSNYFEQLNKSNPDDMTENDLEKATYQMVLNRFQQEQEQEHAEEDFTHVLDELDAAKADLDRYRDSTMFPDVKALYDLAKTHEMEIEEKLQRTQHLLHLIQQSERDLKLALKELHDNQDQDDIDDWQAAEMRKHDVLVKSLKSHLIDHYPFKGNVAF